MSTKETHGEGNAEDFGAAIRDRPVPRISIQAFCESPDTGSVLQRAAMDRRLAKAHVTVHMGGIIAAAEHFTETPTPNLVIVECREKGKLVLERLEQLSHVCDPGSKVIVIGIDNDITLYRELIRAGVNEYIVAPFGPLNIIEAIAALYVGPEAGPIGRVYAFVPAKGGVGSSTVAHNVAWCIAEQMKINTTIVDLDLAFGTAGLDFNQDPVQGVADALLSPERLDETLLDRLLVKYTDRLSLLTAPATLERDYEVDADAYDAVLDLVRQSVPCVVIDLPHLWTPWAKQIMCSADEIIVTASPDLASLRNSKNIFDVVKQARPNDSPARLVLNQVGILKRPEIPAKDFADAVGTEPVLVLPFDPPLFGTAANNGQMVAEVGTQSRAAQGFSHLASLLVGREVQVETKQKMSPLLEFLKGKKKAS